MINHRITHQNHKLDQYLIISPPNKTIFCFWTGQVPMCEETSMAPCLQVLIKALMLMYMANTIQILTNPLCDEERIRKGIVTATTPTCYW